MARFGGDRWLPATCPTRDASMVSELQFAAAISAYGDDPAQRSFSTIQRPIHLADDQVAEFRVKVIGAIDGLLNRFHDLRTKHEREVVL